MQSIQDLSTDNTAFSTLLLAPDSIVLVVFKIVFVLAAAMYVVYSFVIVRQVSIMNATVDTSLGPVIQVAAWLHLLLSVLLGIAVLLFL